MNNDIEQREAARAPTPKAAQPIRIMGFVDGDAIAPACYQAPYRLEPDKKDTLAYDVLRDVMQRTRKVGLVAVVIEKKQALAAVIPIGRTLVLNVLRLASGLVPGTPKRATSESRDTRQATPARPVRLHAVSAAGAVRPAPAALSAQPARTVARMACARKSGEVIDLAVCRSTKRRDARPAKPRSRGVATLHELRRKTGGRTPVERQLA